jgi:CBS domain-containing protein
VPTRTPVAEKCSFATRSAWLQAKSAAVRARRRAHCSVERRSRIVGVTDARPSEDRQRGLHNSRQEADVKVYELMTKEVVAVAPGTPLKEVARLLVEHRISGLPVVDRTRIVRGVVSEVDVLSVDVPQGQPKRRGRLLELALGPQRAETLGTALAVHTAGDAMTSPAVVTQRHEPVVKAARTMRDRRIKRLPVVDDDGRLVGILTLADLVHAFARSDAAIAAEIQSDVVLRGVHVTPGQVEIAIQDGVVTLSGELETKGKAELLEQFTREVAGVVSVDSRLTWRSEDAAPSGIASKR